MLKIDHEIEKYLDHCKNIRQMSQNTIKNKLTILNKLAKETKISSVEELDSNNYSQWLKAELATNQKSSVNIYNSTIVSFVRFYQNSGANIVFNLNSVPHYKTQNLARKYYTNAEIMNITRYANKTEKLIIMIMFETGMRIAEIVNLKVEDIIQSKINFIGKGNKPREVYLSPKTAESLQKYLKKYCIESGYVWCVVDGTKTLTSEPPTVATVRKRLQKVFKTAGYEGFYPHALRHSFATKLQKQGASIEEIKEMMGHSSIATTERYLHGFDGRLEELFNKYQ